MRTPKQILYERIHKKLVQEARIYADLKNEHDCADNASGTIRESKKMVINSFKDTIKDLIELRVYLSSLSIEEIKRVMKNKNELHAKNNQSTNK